MCGINRRPGTDKEKISELENIGTEFIQNEIYREKSLKKSKNRAAVTCGIILSSLAYMQLECQKKRRGKKGTIIYLNK